MSSYYGRSILKQPTWKPEIGLYLFFGGLAGASGVLSFLARVTGNRKLERSGLISAMLGTMVSPFLLITDLGKPARFHHMLRVFKPTSPMSVGTWILSGFGATTTAAAATEALDVMKPVGFVAHLGSAALGPALSTYTAVLVSDTALPAWHDAHRELPFLFAGGAAASAGAAAVMLTPPEDAAPARRMAIGGAILELGSSELMKRKLGEAGKPYEEAEVRVLDQLASGLSIGAVLLIGALGRRRWAATLGGAGLLAGSLCERLAIYRAGFLSAKLTTGGGPEGPSPVKQLTPSEEPNPTEPAPRRLARALVSRFSA
jgi:formate-dependent nitrite reductase membrane component NrfD